MTPGSGLVTILFTDLVGSTELLARAGDEDAQRIFRAHHELLAEAAAAHGGQEVKWLGDGLMVAFASAAEAVGCAIAMQHDSRRAVRGERLSIRVGLNAGETLRDEADFFGLPVVVARRLCDRADAGQILCTDVVAGLLMGRPDFAFTDLGAVELKGVPRPVRAFSVRAEEEAAAFIPSRLPFVGRAPELDRLDHRWAEARAGRGGLVLLAGEPGIGKTRLAEEVAEQAARDGAEVLWGHCFEGEWMPPYAPFAEVVEALVVRADEDGLRADLGTGAAPLAQLVPKVRKVVPEIPEAVALQPPEERFRLFDALARLLEARAARAPVLLCLDDLHWADRGSIDAFHHVVRHLRGHPVLVLGTYRDAEVGRDHPLTEALAGLRRETEYERLVLTGLAADAVRALLDALAEHDVSDAAASVFAAETDGNPFFLRELLQHLIEDGKIYRGAEGRWRSEVPVGELGLPEGVRDVIGRRLARLSPAANRLLGAASLFEGPFRLGVVAAAGGLAEDDALDALDETLAAQLVTAAGGADTYTFTHALIRHTVHADLSPSRRLRLHRHVAEALEVDAGGAPDPAAAGEIATQYLRSRELPGAERGADAALVAAGHAESTGGQAEAAHFLRLALDLLPDDDARRPRVLGRLGVALIWSFAFDDGLDVATRAGERIAATDGPAAAAEYLAGAALTMGVTGNNPRAWALAQQGLEYAEDRRDLAWARLVVLDYQRQERGHPDHPGIALDTPERWEAARILQNANPDPVSIGLLEAPFADRTEARARTGNISVLCCYAGDFSGALPLAEAAARESLSRGQMIRAARSFMTASQCQLSLGNLAEGRTALEEAERLAAPGGSPVFGIRHARECLVALIDDDDALAGVVSEFADLLPALVPGQAWAVGPTLAILARTTARLGRDDEALGYLDQLVPWLERAPAWSHHHPHIVGYAAETLWWLGRLDHGDLVERALQEKLIAPDFRDMEVDARLSMAWLRTLAGRHDEAVAWFAEARRVLGEQRARPLLAVTDFSEGIMYRQRGAGPADEERAVTLLEAARRQFETIGMTGWVRRAERLLA